jgi:asparagine synthase (glutamine-hydrolysing)
MMLSAMRDLGYHPKLCEVGAYCLLTFGFMLGDYTYVENVRRLPPGCILTIRDGVASFTQYYKLTNTPYLEDSKDRMMGELDRRFREAVKSEYEKDLEYGYGHISNLSGGLDSRMSVTYARQLGFQDVLTMTFSQTGYLDEQIAKTISSDYGYHFLFYSLNNGNYLRDLERPLIANDGLVLFPGSAHMLAMETLIDWQRLGIMHTGMAGDLIMGSYLSHPFHSAPGLDTIKKIAYSTKLIKSLPVNVLDTVMRRYENDEMFAFYERCVNGVWNGFWTAQQCTEATSPFLCIDFIDYAMRIHPQYRYRERIYPDWIRRFAPEAVKYPWEKTAGMRIGAPRTATLVKRAMRLMKRYVGSPAYSMNPTEYWYRTNQGLRKSFSSHFERDISYLQSYPKLKDDVAYLFQHGSLLEKSQCLTLLGAIGLFLSEEHS